MNLIINTSKLIRIDYLHVAFVSNGGEEEEFEKKEGESFFNLR